MNYESSRTIYVTNANMAVRLAQFLWFLQNKVKWIKRGQNHSEHGHVESCSSANTEFVKMLLMPGSAESKYVF